MEKKEKLFFIKSAKINALFFIRFDTNKVAGGKRTRTIYLFNLNYLFLFIYFIYFIYFSIMNDFSLFADLVA